LNKALDVTQKPVMISHALIRHGNFNHPRFIDVGDAKRVAETGGLVGVWPAGLGLHSLSDYIDQIFRQIDDIGIDHVAIGTDMDANYKPVFYNYTQAPILAGTLLRRGLNQEEAGKILGGNFLRFFKEVVS
jgi:membrane dipeptidase